MCIRDRIIVEHYPDIVLKTISSAPDMYEWFINEWVHLISVNPDTNELTWFKEGKFIPYRTHAREIHFFRDVHTLLENAKKMETNHICLLYTSDAADERSSVDLGGRRII